jgi:HEAT repeat protein
MALLKSAPTEDAARAPSAPSRPASTLLTALVSGATAAERREAALELAAVPEAARGLSVALGKEAAPAAREAIVTALVVIGTEEAAAGLAAFLDSDDPELRNLAIQALREIGPAAGSQIEWLLASPHAHVRIFAVNVLDAFFHRRDQDRNRLHLLLEHDPEVNVGLAAVEALSQVSGPADVPALRAFAARFPEHPFVGFAVDLVCRRAAPPAGP